MSSSVDLFEECVANDVYSDKGVGCDNMTCEIIQFNN